MTDSKQEGPKVTIQRSCFDCRHCINESYACQSDSGHDVYCGAMEKKRIGDSTWKTPDWCPFIQPDDSASLRAQVATLQARVVELERELANRDEALNARRKYVEKCNHLPSLVIDSESGPICCECWALEEKARADRWQALLEANNDLMPTGNDFYFCVECFFRQVRGMAKEQMDVLRNCGEAIIKAEAENARLTQQLAACEKDRDEALNDAERYWQAFHESQRAVELAAEGLLLSAEPFDKACTVLTAAIEKLNKVEYRKPDSRAEEKQ